MAQRADNGQARWKFQAGGEIHSSALVLEKRVIVAADDGALYAIDAESGTLVWKSQLVPSANVIQVTPGIFSTPVVAEGLIFVGSRYEGSIVAVDPKDGSFSVRHKVGTNSRQLLTAARDGKTLLVTSTGPYSVYALSGSGGGPPLWGHSTGPVYSPPQEGTGGIVVVAGTTTMYAFGPDGTPLDNITALGGQSFVGEPATPRDSGPAAAGAGRVFLSRTGNTVESHAMMYNGLWGRVWEVAPSQALPFPPVLAGSGQLFVSSANGNVAALSAGTGAVNWSKQIDTNLAAKPALGMINVPENKWWVFVVSREGRITALDPSGGGVVWAQPFAAGSTIDSPLTVK